MRISSKFLDKLFFRKSIAFLGLALLAGCATSDGPQSGASQGTPQSSVARVLTPNPVGEVIGNGDVRVSLLVPTTIPGGAAAVAKELRNGAAMAVQDFGQNRIQLVVKDTKGQAANAQASANEAVSEGSSLVLGPLFAANVSAASGVTLPANIVTIAFSTDTTVARRGVYLFSYTPQSDTRRILNFASSLGRNSIAAFLPRNPEGNLRERVLRQTAGANGFSLNVIKYDRTPQGIEQAINDSIGSVQTNDTIYIPEGGPIPGIILSGLGRNGVDVKSKQVLGSGNWESVKASDPLVQGAYYPGRDISRFNNFATRYQGQFGNRPGVQAALAYDAVTLASELVRIHGPNAFSSRNLEVARGFQGINGAFRIRSNGITERGLAIYKITGGRGTLAEPAISNFSGRGS